MEKELELVSDENTQVAVSNVDQVMQYAIQRDLSLEQTEQLLELKAKEDARQAEKDFNQAMSDFSANAPTITKDKSVNFNQTSYNHASLGNVVATIVKQLSIHGLKHRWELEQQADRQITVTCILTHSGGHSIRTSLFSFPDDSGKKNNIQQTASTITYLQRYTLLSITGCATEEDDDGMGANEMLHLQDNQIDFIDGLLEKAGNKEGFFTFFNIMETSDLQQRDYDRAIKILENKIKAKNA